MSTTTIIITDPALASQLAQATGQIQFQDSAGNHVATVEAVPFGVPPPGFKSPISDEELERRRQVRTGRPLADILRDLEQGGAK